MDHLQTSRHAELESVQDRFSAALRQGKSPLVETYLALCDPTNRDKLLQLLLAAEINYFDSTGETLPIAGYRQRFPDQRHIIERLVGSTQDIRLLIDRLGTLGLIPQTVQANLQTELSRPDSQITAESLCQRLIDLAQLTPFQVQFIHRGELNRLTLGEYVLLEKIGQGGMGVVYRARQPAINREVALKTILTRDVAGSEEVRRFRQEAESAARLNHPGIVPVFDFGEADGIHFFTMGLIKGTSLAARLEKSALPTGEAATLLKQLAEAVAYAHGLGVIHRDLKPSNILLELDGSPRITDFGLAKMMDQEGHTMTGEVLGTPSYMPPEQALGKTADICQAADIYSLGAILYACLCGHPPFKAATIMATLKLVIEQQPAPPRQLNQQIPLDLETICLKCLEKDAARRYATASDLAAELDRFLRGEPILARPLSPPQRFARWCRRNRLIATLSAAAAIFLVLGTVVSSYFAVLADQRATRAEEGTRIAVDTLESVIFTVSDKLKNVPAIRQVRKEILARSMKELEALSGFTNRTNAGTAAILVRYADEISELGSDESLGSIADAERFTLRAIEILKQCVAREPDERRHKAELAYASILIGNVYIDQHRLAESREPLQRALTIYRGLYQETPENKAVRRLLSLTLVYWGEMLAQNRDLPGASESFQEAIPLAEQLHAEFPTDFLFHERLIDAIEQEADIRSKMNDLETARSLYRRTSELTDQCVAADPNDPLRLGMASIYYERLGDFALRCGQPDEARQHYEREMEVTMRGVTGDPTNIKLQNDLSLAANKLARVYQQLNRTADATALTKKIADFLLPFRAGNK